MLCKHHTFGPSKAVESNLIATVVDKCRITWIAVKDIYLICVPTIKVKFRGDIISAYNPRLYHLFL